MPSNEPRRIHTIVLTRDRPETLERGVAELLRQLGRDDALTVLDDSATRVTPANAGVLSALAGSGSCAVRHIEWASVAAGLTGSSGACGVEWLERTYSRDIAPLRNYSLLLAAAVPFQTVVLVDDDIVGAVPVVMHEEIREVGEPAIGVVMGARLDGVSEHDVLTRLWQGVGVLGPAGGSSERDPKEVFLACAPLAARLQTTGRYPSGGCLAFALSPGQMTAFPPGYNEDWLWSLLQRDRPDVRIVWSRHSPIHDPPSVRRPTDADCMYELSGDLVLDCLESLVCPAGAGPIERLTLLAQAEPAADHLPGSRLQALREELAEAELGGSARGLLLAYGLAGLERLSRAGMLDVDWQGIVAAWCRRASAVIRSFDASLTEGGVLEQVESEWTKGQVR